MPESTLGLHIKNSLSSTDGQQGNRIPLEEHSLGSCKQRLGSLTDLACSGEAPTAGWSFTYVPLPASAGLLPHLQGKGPRRHEQGVLPQQPESILGTTDFPQPVLAARVTTSSEARREEWGGTLADVPPDPMGGLVCSPDAWLAPPLHLCVASSHRCPSPLVTPDPSLHLAPGLSCVLGQEESRRVPSPTARPGKAQKCLELYHVPLVMCL